MPIQDGGSLAGNDCIEAISTMSGNSVPVRRIVRRRARTTRVTAYPKMTAPNSGPAIFISVLRKKLLTRSICGPSSILLPVDSKRRRKIELAMHASGLSVGAFLPDVQLPAASGPASARLRETGGKITALLTLHSAQCAGCLDYLDRLRPISEEFSDWDARLLIVVPGPASGVALPTHPFGAVLRDEHGSIADGSCASLLVADRYGQIFEAVHSGPSHELPGPRELAEWLKYLGTLCPE